jgi:ATP-dependent RNA helicase DeaD
MTFPSTHPALDRALAARGYDVATPVQKAVAEVEPAGQDLLVSAQTGSGKTVAFGLAIGRNLLNERGSFAPGIAPQVLIIAPTRELALQVSRELEWLYAETGGRIATCVGGMDARREQRRLSGGCEIVVGTPGRLRDHLERGYLDLASIRGVVLDEADEMLDLGFREDLEFILDATPPERQTLLFSATIAKPIADLARRYQRDAVRIATTNQGEPHRDISYQVVRVAPNEIEHAVVNVLRFHEAPGALVFCSTRDAVRHLHSSLRERGFEVVGLSGEMGQRERTDALQALRDGHARVCVATDVAARGLDLPDLGLVIHADLPTNKATLLHRSGRTGRAGRKGTSVLVVPYTRRRKAEMLISSAGVDAEWGPAPKADDIRARDEQRLLNDATLNDVIGDDDARVGAALLEAHGAEKIAALLARTFRAKLPEPEELFEEAARSSEPREYGERAPRREPIPRSMLENAMWFRVNVGRNRNADPRWLIPLICRLGHVTKQEIGSIKVFDRDTRFEIDSSVSDRFAKAVEATKGEEVRIEPAYQDRGPRPEGAPEARLPRKPRPPRAEAEQGFEDRPPRKPRSEERPAYADRGPRPETGGYQAERPPRPRREDTDRPAAERADRPDHGKKPYERSFNKPREDRAPAKTGEYRPELQGAGDENLPPRLRAARAQADGTAPRPAGDVADRAPWEAPRKPKPGGKPSPRRNGAAKFGSNKGGPPKGAPPKGGKPRRPKG